jgi:hypothetical protein
MLLPLIEVVVITPYNPLRRGMSWKLKHTGRKSKTSDSGKIATIGMSTGTSVFHETMESFFAAKDGTGYKSAHLKTNALDLVHLELNWDFTGPQKKTMNVQNPNTLKTVDLYTKP